MDDWQPIETAPKQRNLLLFAVTDADEEGHIRNWKMETGWWSINYDGDKEWRWAGRKLELWDHEPTHWQPLPDPPKEPTRNDGDKP